MTHQIFLLQLQYSIQCLFLVHVFSLALLSVLVSCEPAPPKPLFDFDMAGESQAGTLGGMEQNEAGSTSAGMIDGGKDQAGIEGGSSTLEVPNAHCVEGLMVQGPSLISQEVMIEELGQGDPLSQRGVRGVQGTQRRWGQSTQTNPERLNELNLLSAQIKRDGAVKLILDLKQTGIQADLLPQDLILLSPLGQGIWLAYLKNQQSLDWFLSKNIPVWALQPKDSIDHKIMIVAEQDLSSPAVHARVTLWGASVQDAQNKLQQASLSILKVALKQQLTRFESDPALITHPSYATLPYPKAQGRWTTSPILLPWSDWLKIATHPDVVMITPPMPKPMLLNDPSRLITRAQDVQKLRDPGIRPGSYQGWTGRGVRVAIMDSGVSAHRDFYRYTSSGVQRSERVVGDLPSGGEGHGTIVAGILGGNGWLSEELTSALGTQGTALQWRGQAPEVSTIYSYLMDGENGADERPPWVQAFEAPDEGVAHLINHSHTYNNGYYYPENQGYDAFVAAKSIPSKDQNSDDIYVIEGAGEGSAYPRPVFFAAGNNGFYEQAEYLILKGYYGLMVNFKNNMIIGSIESNDAQHSDSSSLGPTIDGRIKPDLVAPGSSDPRPLSGFKISIGEIRLHARPESRVPDKVWRWSQRNGWAGEAGFDPNDPSTGASIRGEVLEGFTYGNSYRTRLSWIANEEDEVLNPKLYDHLSFELKVDVPQQPTALDHLSDRPPLVLSYDLPQYFSVNWADGQGDRFDGALYFAYRSNLKEGEWTRVRVRLGDQDWAGLELKEIQRLRITPALYMSGVYAPSIQGGYELASGTSMASPAAAGVAALALEQLHTLELYDLNQHPPEPATMRALLNHSARDLIRETPPVRSIPNPDTGEVSVYGKGPDWNTGYGLVDAWALTRLINAHHDSARWHEATIRPKELHRYQIKVHGEGSLKVSLAWDDPPASLLLEQWAPKLIHDLDLAVQGPLNTDGEAQEVYGPWVLTPPPLHSERYHSGEDEFTSNFVLPAERCIVDRLETLWSGEPREGFTPTPLEVTADGFVPQLNRGCVDELNNYEEVLIDAPTAGMYELIVRGPAVGGGAQDYTLVFSESCMWTSLSP